jgi:pimeloyl-ACP methyl ester carboxylesterase
VHSTQRLDVDGVSLALRTWTAVDPGAPPVLLLPATGCTAADWDTVASHLVGTRTVHVLDLRGHGESDWPGTYSLRLVAHDVIGVLDRLRDPVLDVVGHSLGGLVACLAVAERPRRVRRLVLEDVPLPHSRPASAVERPGGPLDFDWAVVEQVRPEIDDPAPDWPDVVSRIPVPTLVLAGGASSPVPQAHVRELATTLPRGRLETIEAGHCIHETRPEEFLERVAAFLAP